METSPLKLFISYSHTDKSYLETLSKHLVVLKDNGVISEWTDKQLVAGDDLDDEIKEHLKSSDLVVFLVSVDFLNSWYCYRVELKESLERLENDECRVIPVIIRDCHWKDSLLKKYTALPEDGKAVSNAQNQDSVYVEIVEGIKKAANKFLEFKSKMEETDPVPQKKNLLNPDFAKELNDAEVVFCNRNKPEVLLDDIFVFPDVKNLMEDVDNVGNIISSKDFTTEEIPGEKILILGGEQSGKTSLAKTIFKVYFNTNYLPLCCVGSNINSPDASKVFFDLVPRQYENLDYDSFIADPRPKILIVDDYELIKLNIRYQGKFLESAFSLMDKMIIISNSSIKYTEEKYIELSDYLQFEIMPFGHLLRYELIGKWVGMGVLETKDIVEIHNETDVVARHVDSIIRRNIVPPKPFHVLSIIQMMENMSGSDFTMTSYGHCYQSLILSCLNKVHIRPNEYDLYLNYSAEMAYFIFKAGEETINEGQLDEFKEEYSKKFIIESHEEVLDVLLSSGILRFAKGNYSFSYRYIFYFYVAKYIADNLLNDGCKTVFEGLCENLHTEKNANIIIFLVHHSKNPCITDEIYLTAEAVFEKYTPATLRKNDIQFLFKYIESIPNLVLEQKSIDEERRKRLKARDEVENSRNSKEDSGGAIESEKEDFPADSFYAETGRCVRLVEIIGQILRNRHGSLTREQLKDLTISAYSSGLRLLTVILLATDKHEEGVVRVIEEQIRDNTELSNEEITKLAKKRFWMLCYSVCLSVVKKIAFSLGTEKLLPIYDEISKEHEKSPAHHLIEVAIILEFTKKIPKKQMSKLFTELDGNAIGRRILQDIMVQHSYLNHINTDDKQWISDVLKISMKFQRRLDAFTQNKKRTPPKK